jgi:hypothetical protein
VAIGSAQGEAFSVRVWEVKINIKHGLTESGITYGDYQTATSEMTSRMRVGFAVEVRSGANIEITEAVPGRVHAATL